MDKKGLNYTLIATVTIILLLSGCRSSKQSIKYVDNESKSETKIEHNYEHTVEPEDNVCDTSVVDLIILEARRWLGTPYKYGKNVCQLGTDCSGMIMSVFANAANIKLPRDSRSQQKFCTPIEANDLLAGDLIFFSSKKHGKNIGHVGLYIGNDTIIHASTSKGVIESNIQDKYYVEHYHSAGRIDAIFTSSTDKKFSKNTNTIERQVENNSKTLQSTNDTQTTIKQNITTTQDSLKLISDSIKNNVRNAMKNKISFPKDKK